MRYITILLFIVLIRFGLANPDCPVETLKSEIGRGLTCSYPNFETTCACIDRHHRSYNTSFFLDSDLKKKNSEVRCNLQKKFTERIAAQANEIDYMEHYLSEYFPNETDRDLSKGLFDTCKSLFADDSQICPNKDSCEEHSNKKDKKFKNFKEQYQNANGALKDDLLPSGDTDV